MKMVTNTNREFGLLLLGTEPWNMATPNLSITMMKTVSLLHIYINAEVKEKR
jgi:hypothetical protein